MAFVLGRDTDIDAASAAKEFDILIAKAQWGRAAAEHGNWREAAMAADIITGRAEYLCSECQKRRKENEQSTADK
jgi:hypothetical protein